MIGRNFTRRPEGELGIFIRPKASGNTKKYEGIMKNFEGIMKNFVRIMKKYEGNMKKTIPTLFALP